MHNLVLSVVISVWIFADSSVNGAITISYEGSKKVDSTTYSLKCEIPGFSSLAGWSRAGSSIATCTNSGCNPTSTASYTFRHAASAIYVDFNTLGNSENGIQWICEHLGDTSVSFDVQIDFGEVTTEGSTEGLETSTTFESSSIIESASTSIFVESNAGTDVSQLNTLNIFSFSSDAENFSSSIVTSDRKQTENFETIDTTNALLIMNTTSSIPNSVLSSMSLIQNFDSYKTSIQSSMIETVTISPLTVTIESDYQSTSSYFDAASLFSETTIGILTSGLYMTTPEISPGLIYSALNSSFSSTTEVCPTNTFTETVSTDITSTETISAGMTSTETVSTGMTSTETGSTGMTSSYKMFDIVTEGNETTSITSITAANVLTRYSLSDDIPVLQTTFDSFTTSGSPIHQPMESLITSTTMSYFFTSISEEAVFSSSFTFEAPRSTNTVLTAEEYESMMTSKFVYENTSVFELASRKVPTNSQSSSEISLDSYYSVSIFISFLTTHEGSLININDPSLFKTESDMGLFNSSLVNPNFLLSLNATSDYIKEASASQFNLSNPELGGTSSTIIFEKGDFDTTPLSYSSVIDTVKYTSDFVMTSPFNEQSVSVTQNSFLSSLTIKKTLIQTSSVRNNEAESAYTERHSSLPTKLFSSMPDKITETVSSANDDKVILLTSTEHILLVASSLNTLGSLTEGVEDSVLITESFVKMISRSSNELATSSSSLDTFSPKYVKTTTTIQHGLSESSKDDIFISAVSGTIAAIILVVLIAMVISRYFMKRNKFKDGKDDEISNQLGWSDDGGTNSYNKNYTSREYPFNSSIHLPLHSYESPYFPYANYYKKNWDDNT